MPSKHGRTLFNIQIGCPMGSGPIRSTCTAVAVSLPSKGYFFDSNTSSDICWHTHAGTGNIHAMWSFLSQSPWSIYISMSIGHGLKVFCHIAWDECLQEAISRSARADRPEIEEKCFYMVDAAPFMHARTNERVGLAGTPPLVHFGEDCAVWLHFRLLSLSTLRLTI